MPYDSEQIIHVFSETADAIAERVSGGVSWAKSGGHKGQHQGDVDADEIGIEIITRQGMTVYSEESGYTYPETPETSEWANVVVVIDPVDGSTNASKGIPFYSVSLCAVVDGVPAIGMVRNLVSGDTYLGQAGLGSTKNGKAISPSDVTEISKAIVGINGYPSKYLGWAQYRAFGSAALELCMVSEGSLDGYIDLSKASLASWDVLGGLLICRESGATVLCQDGSDYAIADLKVRKRIVVAGTQELARGLHRKAWG
ncbi:MAG: inositol monophosphatase [Actinomycetota bacterium]|nr:MAG: inositol monophosphatase [Actinomycetota bacterium]